MTFLGPRLKQLGLDSSLIEGPNMEKYCPEGDMTIDAGKAAGMRLLEKEWHGRMPDKKTYDLHLFQIATLVGHLRAWQHIADTKVPAVVLEDDADITSTAALETAIKTTNGVNAVLLDYRHCAQHPPSLSQYASGMTGYWLDHTAAQALLDNFPLSIPIDWGVNDVFNHKVKATCPSAFPVLEHGGDAFARIHSTSHGCGGIHDNPPAGHHIVAMILRSAVRELGGSLSAY